MFGLDSKSEQDESAATNDRAKMKVLIVFILSQLIFIPTNIVINVKFANV